MPLKMELWPGRRVMRTTVELNPEGPAVRLLYGVLIRIALKCFIAANFLNTSWMRQHRRAENCRKLVKKGCLLEQPQDMAVRVRCPESPVFPRNRWNEGRWTRQHAGAEQFGVDDSAIGLTDRKGRAFSNYREAV